MTAATTTGPNLTLDLLGPVEAHLDGVPLKLGGAKPRTVLAALLLARGRVVTDATLTALLWGERPPATSPAQLHTYASRIRRLLGPAVTVERRRPGYLLALPEHGVRVDWLEFRTWAGRGTRALADGDPATAAGLLRRALAHWRGTALGGVCDPLADAERPRLEEERHITLEARLDADLELGRYTELVPELMALVAANPLREGLRGRLMTALHRSGRQADALAAYRATRAVLAEELGIEPCAELQQLHQALLTGRPAPGPAPTPVTTPATAPAATVAAGAARTPHSVPAELPPAPAAFTGRDRQIRLLHADLTAPRTDTSPPAVHVVTGMPGAGKTALAVHTAHRVRNHYPDGQVHLDLRGSGPDPMPPTDALAELLRLLDAPGRAVPDRAGDRLPENRLPHRVEDRLRTYRTRIADRRLLLVLDDAADEAQVRPLLPATGRCAVLVTGRSGLHALPGAARTTLGPLGGTDSRRVLETLAGRDRVAAEPEAAAALVEACAGLPLALHVVGARLAARPHGRLSRLARRLTAPGRTLDELAYADLSVPALLHQAYARLTPAARHALALLAAPAPCPVSAGTVARHLGVGPDRAEDLLAELAAHHWAETVPEPYGTRYRLHPLVRLFTHALPSPAAATRRVLALRPSPPAPTRTDDAA